MFENLVPSADSAATGIVALLAVAEALGRVKDDFLETDRPIMLNFYHGVSGVNYGTLYGDVLTFYSF